MKKNFLGFLPDFINRYCGKYYYAEYGDTKGLEHVLKMDPIEYYNDYCDLHDIEKNNEKALEIDRYKSEIDTMIKKGVNCNVFKDIFSRLYKTINGESIEDTRKREKKRKSYNLNVK